MRDFVEFRISLVVGKLSVVGFYFLCVIVTRGEKMTFVERER